MQIQELTPGQEITLLVRVNGNSLAFTSRVQEVAHRKHMIIADAVFHGNKPISFKGKGVILDVLVAVADEKPRLFKNVSSTLLRKSDDTFCYSLTTLADSIPYNRRGNFRCYIGIETSIRFGSNSAAHPAIIRDVSSTGFAVVCDSDVKFRPGQLLHAVLDDQIEEYQEKYFFHLYGLVARIQELENGKTVYGCRLNNKVIGLEDYIIKKERYRLKQHSGGKP